MEEENKKSGFATLGTEKEPCKFKQFHHKLDPGVFFFNTQSLEGNSYGRIPAVGATVSAQTTDRQTT